MKVRELRKPPEAIIATRWGELLLRASGSDDDRVQVRTPPIPNQPAHLYQQPQAIVVNGVEYLVGVDVVRRGGKWDTSGHFHLHRRHDKKSGTYRWEATYNAVRQVRDSIADVCGAWLDEHAYFLREARRVRRHNELAELEGAVAGAEEQLAKAREALREALAAPEDD